MNGERTSPGVSPEARQVPPRRPALDGLRGLAALVVVVHHCVLIAPSLATGFTRSAPRPSLTFPWLLAYTPLHLLWAGEEAVWIFFVLSGLVLALPYVSGAGQAWRAYYPQRLLRLYLPIAAAVWLAYALVRLVPRHPRASSSSWLASHRSPVGIPEALKNTIIVRGTTWLDSPLWSLRWEIFFSLLLPVFLLVLLSSKIPPLTAAFALLAVASYGELEGYTGALYLPIFGLGVIMARETSRLDAWGRRFDEASRATRYGSVAAVCALLVGRWWVFALLESSHPIGRAADVDAAATALTLLASCSVVWLFGSTRAGRRLGERKSSQWLGKRSFSLYLVHEPIVVTVAYLLGGTTDALLVLILSVPLSLAAAAIFSRCVERPSHRLARAAGKRRAPVQPYPYPGGQPAAVPAGGGALSSQIADHLGTTPAGT